MDARYRERNRETTEGWVKGIAIGFRSEEVSFHQRPRGEDVREQKASEKREIRGGEREGGEECYPPL